MSVALLHSVYICILLSENEVITLDLKLIYNALRNCELWEPMLMMLAMPRATARHQTIN